MVDSLPGRQGSLEILGSAGGGVAVQRLARRLSVAVMLGPLRRARRIKLASASGPASGRS